MGRIMQTEQKRFAEHRRFLICMVTLCISLAFVAQGCGKPSRETWQDVDTEAETVIVLEEDEEPKIRMEDVCLELYREAGRSGRLGEKETIAHIVKQFGENGYPAVDQKNRVDMVRASEVKRFCRRATDQQEAQIEIVEVDWNGGFVEYELQAAEGNLDVTRNYYHYEDEMMRKKTEEHFTADSWSYTEDGYLMFSGTGVLDEMYVMTLSDVKEYAALRVEPLDEACREWNEKALLPVGYECNNLFLTDWDETDFGELDFYDLFDVFYPQIYHRKIPWQSGENAGNSTVYGIPSKEFESVIQKFLNVKTDILRKKTIYREKDDTYEYYPRGFYESEYPEHPYPEVTAFQENDDGTVTLTVHAVFPYLGSSRALVHEVTVRPMENAAAAVRYVSNKIISSLDECSVEGNMTRLMAVFKDWKNIERIGNIRSCRDYYVYWAKEWDAIYCHIGGPFYILNAINDPTTNNITGAVLASDPSQKKGLYDAAFYRTSDRKAPHNAYTSGDRIDKAAQALGYSETYTENYQSDHFKFASTNNPNTLEQYGSSAIPATKIDLAGAYPITKTYFEYNEEDGLYYRFQGMQKGDQKHMDGANNKQLSFKNVLVQFAYYETRDAKGYLSFQCHDDTKDGYYFTNGKGIHVTWKKTSDFAPTKFYDDNGNEIEINPGKTNICVVEQGKSIDAE